MTPAALETAPTADAQLPAAGAPVTREADAAAVARPAAPTARAASRDELIRLPGSAWAMWPLAVLRGAGLPTERVLALSSPSLAQLALRTLSSRAPELRDALRRTFAAERLRLRDVLRDIARDPCFREAVAWQNPRAFRTAVDRLANTPIDRDDASTREKQRLVARYAQRYAVKNDTIGFFGPVGWARFSNDSIAARVEPGPGLVASRRVFFEAWGIDAVAHAFDRRLALRPWRIPRIPSFVRLEGTRLMMASRLVADLSSDQARLFAACDGSRHAKALADEFQRGYPHAFPTADVVYDILEGWQRAGHLTWTFEGPRDVYPERMLAERLRAIDDEVLRAQALEDLQMIDDARRDAEAAAGNADAVAAALDRLESEFARVTSVAPTRANGQMYAARTLVYVDCRRDVAVDFGRDVLHRLGPPMSLVLRSARWAVHELVRRHAIEFRRVFDTLARGGSREVTLGAFFARTSLVGDTRGALSPIAEGVRDALQQRWGQILGVPTAAHHLRFRARDLRQAVAAAFDLGAPPPSAWARYLSPDVMIDARDEEAVRRGDYQLVLGELHVLNALAQSAFMTQCPDAEEVVRALDRDCPEPRVFWLTPKEGAPQRVQYTRKPNDYVYVASRDPSPAAATRTLRVADLIVVDTAGELFVQTRDGRLRFPCAEFFGYLVMRKEVNVFSPLAQLRHRPRVTIDGVVIAREQWQVPARELAFAARGDELQCFVDCLRWADAEGVPRFVFVRIPSERKPIYADLHSPVFVDLIARSIRLAQRADPATPITITEMLPTPFGAWLAGPDGARYTSELRIVAVDPFVPKALNLPCVQPSERGSGADAVSIVFRCNTGE